MQNRSNGIHWFIKISEATAIGILLGLAFFVSTLSHTAQVKAATPIFTLDGAVVFVKDSAILYSFRGHEYGDPTNWKWWSIGPTGEPDITAPTKPISPISVSGQDKRPDVALSRGGNGLAVWHVTPNGVHIKQLYGDEVQHNTGTPSISTQPMKIGAPTIIRRGYHRFEAPGISVLCGSPVAIWRYAKVKPLGPARRPDDSTPK